MKQSASTKHSLFRRLIKILIRTVHLEMTYHKWVNMNINKKCMLIKLNPASLEKFLIIEKQKSELYIPLKDNFCLFKMSVLCLKVFSQVE